jgi:hypothetical protein
LFSVCFQLSQINILVSLEEFCDRCFYKYSSLTDFFTSLTTTISKECFHECTQLTQLNISTSPEKLIEGFIYYITPKKKSFYPIIESLI